VYDDIETPWPDEVLRDRYCARAGLILGHGRWDEKGYVTLLG
jgi:hypothetical protein